MTSSKEQIGVKGKVAKALEDAKDQEGKWMALTMGEIIGRADIPKTQAPEVSSALFKLRNQGLVQTVRGPASSANGPRFVRKYKWARVPGKTVAEASVAPRGIFAGLNVIGG